MFLHFLQEKAHKLAFLELAHLIANADGFVNRKEQLSLKTYMGEMDLPDTFFAVGQPREIGAIIGELQDEQVKHIIFLEILLLIFADGDYNENERSMLSELKHHFGVSEETYDVFKDWVIRMDQLKIEGMKLILGSFRATPGRSGSASK
ncbi:tellurite resistance protein [Paenibacillus phyllosphaerae]|uniref:Tellurite resistance protein n=1 Tax=Paenibacillus phyllosphaerae TaxID=274593 RepID=A0A7W5FMQ6_9BACL|nr:TerB family tellurite resistance protein [Paenibacillus phyllosphaerae]MBB3110249.1 tellurite resistance protein [Paenibacillus phyllosphaerae]